MRYLRPYNESQDNSFFFSQDESSHWYMIPTSLKSRWKELNSRGEDDDEANDLIESEFGQYRTGGGIENISFENPQKN